MCIYSNVLQRSFIFAVNYLSSQYFRFAFFRIDLFFSSHSVRIPYSFCIHCKNNNKNSAYISKQKLSSKIKSRMGPIQIITMRNNNNSSKEKYSIDGSLGALHAAATLKQINCDFIFFDGCRLPLLMSFHFLPLSATRGTHD